MWQGICGGEGKDKKAANSFVRIRCFFIFFELKTSCRDPKGFLCDQSS